MNHLTFGPRLTGHVIIGNVVFQIIQFAMFFLVDNLFIAEAVSAFGSQFTMRTPR